MTRWQRRARLFIAVFAAVFAVVVFRQLRPRPAPRAATPVPRTDPVAVAEVASGRLERFKSSRQDVSVEFQKQLTYADGSMKLAGVTITADARDGTGSFTATGKEANVGPDGSTIVLNGDVHLVSSEVRARTEHATYARNDNTVRAPGPVELTEGHTTAKGVGMTFDRDRDVLSILDQAVVHMADDNGGGATEVTCATATFARRERYRRFEKNVRLQRGGQIIEAETAVAYLSEDGKRVDTVELRGGARMTATKAAAGALQALTGQDVNLSYGADTQALQHAVITGNAVIRLAGDTGQPGREISANAIDITIAADGSTPTALVARDAVQLTMPPEPGVPGRTIRSTTLEAKGAPGRGLTRAQFTGNVLYRERGQNVDRAASSGTLDVGLKPGMSGLEDANFAHAVTFEDEGKIEAHAAHVRYDVEKGTLEFSGSEPGALAPRVVAERIAVDAVKIDVTLDGPKVKATGTAANKVKSVLQPAQKTGQKPTDSTEKLPSMLKQDQPVNVTATMLDYDGTTSRSAYKGSAQLWQGDTSIKGESILIDGKTGDLTASAVASATMLEQTNKDNQKERVRSVATAKDLKYEDTPRRLTYTGDAHLSGPEGDMTAKKIELYLKPSGDELDRAEAYDDVTLREQNRKTTGARMTYTTADERYVVVGVPVKIIDECERETIGKTLTFLKATDSIVVDGNQQIRTQTKGGGKCPSTP